MRPDAVVVGAGPNGLVAAIVLASAGLSVTVFEAAETAGGGARSAELTRPGFVHDVCSAVFPFWRSPALTAVLGPAVADDDLAVDWVRSPSEMAHPLDGGRAVLLHRDVGTTVAQLGSDASRYRHLVGASALRADDLFSETLRPLVHVPRHPVALARFGAAAIRSASSIIDGFEEKTTAALFAGAAAHSMTSLRAAGSAAVGLSLMAAGHAYGWPIVAGGTGRLSAELARRAAALGVEIVCGVQVRSLDDLPPARVTLLSVPPPALARMAGDRLGPAARRSLRRWRFGPGIFKVDWALSAPVPWAAEEMGSAITVHLGGSAAEIVAAEEMVWRGHHPDRPFVLFTQPSLFDRERAPDGAHTAWAYCHVPNGSTVDMTRAIEAQVERFAPGFGEVILDRHTMSSEDVASYNLNYVGGDIGSGAFTLRQMLGRPRFVPNPYRTSLDGVFLCGASTAPGPGVHGMSGWNAARAALASIGVAPPT